MSLIKNKIDNAEMKNTPLTNNTSDNCSDGHNASYRLQSSHNSTISNESDISLLSLSLDKDLEGNSNAIDIDELPAFEIRLISPLGRTPSPIDTEDVETPTRQTTFIQERIIQITSGNNPEFVALHDINAQISPPSDNGDEGESSLSRAGSLETIYEGVFLNTPPRPHLSLQSNRTRRSRTNKFEKMALNRVYVGKENQSPSPKCETPPQRLSLSLSCEPNSYPIDEKH